MVVQIFKFFYHLVHPSFKFFELERRYKIPKEPLSGCVKYRKIALLAEIAVYLGNGMT